MLALVIQVTEMVPAPKMFGLVVGMGWVKVTPMKVQRGASYVDWEVEGSVKTS